MYTSLIKNNYIYVEGNLKSMFYPLKEWVFKIKLIGGAWLRGRITNSTNNVQMVE
jgi:hypothetical protein